MLEPLEAQRPDRALPRGRRSELLGLDHEKLTFRYAGRDFRLTDVQGRVVRGVIS